MGGEYRQILKVKGLGLFSGGLDSILAAKVIMAQGVEVMGVTCTTPFFSPEKAKAAAKQIGLYLIEVDITKEHLDMLKSPRYGYGKNMNPCIDCHTLMLKIAGRIMEDRGPILFLQVKFSASVPCPRPDSLFMSLRKIQGIRSMF
jgi:tRNA U34 2-thiouridine synthase MnmA/TrmU